jgi:hypothetical protein
VEQTPTRERLPQDDTGGEDIRTRARRLPEHLLRRHVRQLADERPRRRVLRVIDRLRRPEIEHLHEAAAADHDVLRRHVTVHDVQPLP